MISSRLPAQAVAPADRIVGELRQGLAADALRDAEQAVRAQPRDARLWILKGLAANQLQQSDVALSAFNSALRLSPNSIPALEGASEVAFRIDRSQARELLRRLLVLLPDEPNANGMAGMLDYEEGQWAAAVQHFSKAGTAIATQEAALEAQAASLYRLGRPAEAEAVFRAIAERWPDDRQVRYNLALAQTRQGLEKEALATLQPLLDTADQPVFSLASSLYESQGDTPNAVAVLRRAIQQDPRNPQNYIDFAALSFDHSSFAAGISMLDAGLSQLPQSAALHVARGILYMQNAQAEKAAQDFELANKLDPRQSFGLEAQGLTEMQRHNLPEALAKVQQSLQATPQSAYLNYLAAEILKEQGAQPASLQAKQAIAYAQRATALDARLVVAFDLLSSLQFQNGDYAKAAEACRAALKVDPADQEALFRLILIVRRTGDKNKEIAGLVENLKKARADEHNSHVKVDRYRLSEVFPSAGAASKP
ncbi:MAG: hypothetical protein NVSMB3_00500 [Acidobacteriaceae bacterium]